MEPPHTDTTGKHVHRTIAEAGCGQSWPIFETVRHIYQRRHGMLAA